MALITCPECEKRISDRAGTCPSCGYPIAGGGTTQANAGKVQTIEKTSKVYKLQMILSLFLLMIGCLATSFTLFAGGYAMGDIADAPPIVMLGIVVMAIGLIWFIIVQFSSWWHHG
jgi:hypothetical protein